MTTRGTSTAAYVNPLSLIDPVCNLDLVVSEGKISVTKGMLILCPQFPGNFSSISMDNFLVYFFCLKVCPSEKEKKSIIPE